MKTASGMRVIAGMWLAFADGLDSDFGQVEYVAGETAQIRWVVADATYVEKSGIKATVHATKALAAVQHGRNLLAST